MIQSVIKPSHFGENSLELGHATLNFELLLVEIEPQTNELNTKQKSHITQDRTRSDAIFISSTVTQLNKNKNGIAL